MIKSDVMNLTEEAKQYESSRSHHLEVGRSERDEVMG